MEILRPAIDRINKHTGQENHLSYMAYRLEYLLTVGRQRMNKIKARGWLVVLFLLTMTVAFMGRGNSNFFDLLILFVLSVIVAGMITVWRY